MLFSCHLYLPRAAVLAVVWMAQRPSSGGFHQGSTPKPVREQGSSLTHPFCSTVARQAMGSGHIRSQCVRATERVLLGWRNHSLSLPWAADTQDFQQQPMQEGSRPSQCPCHSARVPILLQPRVLHASPVPSTVPHHPFLLFCATQKSFGGTGQPISCFALLSMAGVGDAACVTQDARASVPFGDELCFLSCLHQNQHGSGHGASRSGPGVAFKHGHCPADGETQPQQTCSSLETSPPKAGAGPAPAVNPSRSRAALQRGAQCHPGARSWSRLAPGPFIFPSSIFRNSYFQAVECQ